MPDRATGAPATEARSASSRRRELPSAARHEAATNGLSELAANGNVLEVRIGRRQAPGARHRLVERGVQAPGLRVHEPGQRVEIGVLELRQLPVLHEQGRQGMPFVGQFLQHRRVGGWPGGGLLLHRKPELIEEDVPQLRVGVDVELLPRHLVDLQLHHATLARKAAPSARQTTTRRW